MSLSQYFEAKKRLYPQSTKGLFRKLKTLLNVIFLAIYLFTPFLRFDRGPNAPNQAILIDLANSKGYFFAIEMWPSEVFYLALILILAAVTLFFVTAFFGRIWCGYACFQTVWTDIFIGVERIFQGERNQRILLDRKNNFSKFWRKSLTHLTWILIALITGFAFTNYFSDAFAQINGLKNGEISTSALLWTLGLAAMTYLMAGFAREHVCTFMCPYARFQSAMFDKNTLIIAYDEKRGEPRGHIKDKSAGDCIDCKQCVVVCPQGIDIRDGLQMECIACGLCIDACDEIMEKINRPKGLVRYETQKGLENPKNGFKLFRFRFFYYVTVLTLAFSFLGYSLLSKKHFQAQVIAKRNPPYVMLSDGSIRNGYILKITNKTAVARDFRLRVKFPSEAKISVKSWSAKPLENLTAASKSVTEFRVFVTLKKDFLQEKQGREGLIESVLIGEGGQEIPLTMVFLW